MLWEFNAEKLVLVALRLSQDDGIFFGLTPPAYSDVIRANGGI